MAGNALAWPVFWKSVPEADILKINTLEYIQKELNAELLKL